MAILTSMSTPPPSSASFTAARTLVLHSLTWVYLFAFTSLWSQLPGLYGTDGLMPADLWVHRINAVVPASASWKDIIIVYLTKPTLAVLANPLGVHVDALVEFNALAGVLLSAILAAGLIRPSTLSMLTLFLLYLSLYTIGQTFMSFQWDIFLLEVGFLVAWWATPLPTRLFSFRRRQQQQNQRVAHVESTTSRSVHWCLCVLFFKFMYMNGVVKLQSQCPEWQSLNALSSHFATQCIPSPAAWYFHQLPPALLQIGVAATLVIEIPLPFVMLSGDVAWRRVCALGVTLLQVLIIVTGNYNFFNLLTMVMNLVLIDDQVFNICGKHWRSLKKRLCRFRSRKNEPLQRENERLHEVDKPFHDAQPLQQKNKPSQQANEPSQPIQTSSPNVVLSPANFSYSQMSRLLYSTASFVLFLGISFVMCYDVMAMFSVNESPSLERAVKLAWTPQDLSAYVIQRTPLAMLASVVVLAYMVVKDIQATVLLRGGSSFTATVWLGWVLLRSVMLIGVLLIGFVPMAAMESEVMAMVPRPIVSMYRASQPWSIVSGYGLFRHMTGVTPDGKVARPELMIQQRFSAEGEWEQVRFKYKPDPHDSAAFPVPPIWVAPHHPRLDWQMWFAALQPSYQGAPWIIQLVDKLLEGSSDVRNLLLKNEVIPGQDELQGQLTSSDDQSSPSSQPRLPLQVRVVRYYIDFTRYNTSWADHSLPKRAFAARTKTTADSAGKGTFAWWWNVRGEDEPEEFVPAIERNNPSVAQFLKVHGWERRPRISEPIIITASSSPSHSSSPLLKGSSASLEVWCPELAAAFRARASDGDTQLSVASELLLRVLCDLPLKARAQHDGLLIAVFTYVFAVGLTGNMIAMFSD